LACAGVLACGLSIFAAALDEDHSGRRDTFSSSLRFSFQRGRLRHLEVGETYNVGGRNERTNLYVVETICDLLDQLAPRRRPASPPDHFCDPVVGAQFVAQDAQEYPPIDTGDYSEAPTSQIQITIVHARLNLPRCCKRATSSEIRLSVHF
jgi:hypothetical protein